MQTPYRKHDKVPQVKKDAMITEEKLQELLKRKEKLLNIDRPRESKEVKRLALMGDFSENAGYQLAKSRLRGINSRILEIEDIVRRAEIITADKDCDSVKIGHSVVLKRNSIIKEYKILGSMEVNPMAGLISYSSPLGSSLLDKKVGETVEIRVGEKLISYKIIAIK